MKEDLNIQEAELNARKMLSKLDWSNAVEFKQSILKLKNIINLPEYFATDYGRASWDEAIKCVDAWELVRDVGYNLDGAKQFCDFAKDMKYLQKRGKMILIDDVRKAIALVEEVESLREEG